MCELTGTRKYSSDLPQGGLEVPCQYSFSSSSSEISKLQKLPCGHGPSSQIGSITLRQILMQLLMSSIVS